VPDIQGPAQVEALVLGAITSFGVASALVSPDARIDRLDLDPLDLTELCHLLEEQCDAPVTAADLANCITVEDLVALVCRASGVSRSSST